MDVLAKLEILTDAAKYDAACTSSGVRRGFQPGKIGNTTSSIAGCCHSFSADGRCITLLKVLIPSTNTEEGKEEAFETRRQVERLMGKNPESRFKFIIERAKFVEDLDI